MIGILASPAASQSSSGYKSSCFKPYKITFFVRNRFEEAARRYASVKRTAALFPPSPSAPAVKADSSGKSNASSNSKAASSSNSKAASSSNSKAASSGASRRTLADQSHSDAATAAHKKLNGTSARQKPLENRWSFRSNTGYGTKLQKQSATVAPVPATPVSSFSATVYPQRRDCSSAIEIDQDLIGFCEDQNEGDPILQDLQSMRSDFVPPSSQASAHQVGLKLLEKNAKSSHRRVQKFVPPIQRAEIPNKNTVRFGRPLFKKSATCNPQQVPDPLSDNFVLDEWFVEENSPPRPSYHLYRLDEHGTAHSLPVSVLPTNQNNSLSKTSALKGAVSSNHCQSIASVVPNHRTSAVSVAPSFQVPADTAAPSQCTLTTSVAISHHSSASSVATSHHSSIASICPSKNVSNIAHPPVKSCVVTSTCSRPRSSVTSGAPFYPQRVLHGGFPSGTHEFDMSLKQKLNDEVSAYKDSPFPERIKSVKTPPRIPKRSLEFVKRDTVKANLPLNKSHSKDASDDVQIIEVSKEQSIIVLSSDSSPELHNGDISNSSAKTVAVVQKDLSKHPLSSQNIDTNNALHSEENLFENHNDGNLYENFNDDDLPDLKQCISSSSRRKVSVEKNITKNILQNPSEDELPDLGEDCFGRFVNQALINKDREVTLQDVENTKKSRVEDDEQSLASTIIFVPKSKKSSTKHSSYQDIDKNISHYNQGENFSRTNSSDFLRNSQSADRTVTANFKLLSTSSDGESNNEVEDAEELDIVRLSRADNQVLFRNLNKVCRRQANFVETEVTNVHSIPSKFQAVISNNPKLTLSEQIDLYPCVSVGREFTTISGTKEVETSSLNHGSSTDIIAKADMEAENIVAKRDDHILVDIKSSSQTCKGDKAIREEGSELESFSHGEDYCEVSGGNEEDHSEFHDPSTLLFVSDGDIIFPVHILKDAEVNGPLDLMSFLDINSFVKSMNESNMVDTHTLNIQKEDTGYPTTESIPDSCEKELPIDLEKTKDFFEAPSTDVEGAVEDKLHDDSHDSAKTVQTVNAIDGQSSSIPAEHMTEVLAKGDVNVVSTCTDDDVLIHEEGDYLASEVSALKLSSSVEQLPINVDGCKFASSIDGAVSTNSEEQNMKGFVRENKLTVEELISRERQRFIMQELMIDFYLMGERAAKRKPEEKFRKSKKRKSINQLENDCQKLPISHKLSSNEELVLYREENPNSGTFCLKSGKRVQSNCVPVQARNPVNEHTATIENCSDVVNRSEEVCSRLERNLDEFPVGSSEKKDQLCHEEVMEDSTHESPCENLIKRLQENPRTVCIGARALCSDKGTCNSCEKEETNVYELKIPGHKASDGVEDCLHALHTSPKEPDAKERHHNAEQDHSVDTHDLERTDCECVKSEDCDCSRRNHPVHEDSSGQFKSSSNSNVEMNSSVSASMSEQDNQPEKNSSDENATKVYPVQSIYHEVYEPPKAIARPVYYHRMISIKENSKVVGTLEIHNLEQVDKESAFGVPRNAKIENLDMQEETVETADVKFAKNSVSAEVREFAIKKNSEDLHNLDIMDLNIQNESNNKGRSEVLHSSGIEVTNLQDDVCTDGSPDVFCNIKTNDANIRDIPVKETSDILHDLEIENSEMHEEVASLKGENVDTQEIGEEGTSEALHDSEIEETDKQEPGDLNGVKDSVPLETKEISTTRSEAIKDAEKVIQDNGNIKVMTNKPQRESTSTSSKFLQNSSSMVDLMQRINAKIEQMKTRQTSFRPFSKTLMEKKTKLDYASTLRDFMEDFRKAERPQCIEQELKGISTIETKNESIQITDKKACQQKPDITVMDFKYKTDPSKPDSCESVKECKSSELSNEKPEVNFDEQPNDNKDKILVNVTPSNRVQILSDDAIAKFPLRADGNIRNIQSFTDVPSLAGNPCHDKNTKTLDSSCEEHSFVPSQQIQESVECSGDRTFCSDKATSKSCEKEKTDDYELKIPGHKASDGVEDCPHASPTSPKEPDVEMETLLQEDSSSDGSSEEPYSDNHANSQCSDLQSLSQLAKLQSNAVEPIDAVLPAFVHSNLLDDTESESVKLCHDSVNSPPSTSCWESEKVSPQASLSMSPTCVSDTKDSDIVLKTSKPSFERTRSNKWTSEEISDDSLRKTTAKRKRCEDMGKERKKDKGRTAITSPRCRKKKRTLQQIRVSLNDTYRQCLKLMVDAGESLLSVLKDNSLTLPNLDGEFLSIRAEITRFLLNQLMRSRRASSELECAETNRYQNLLIIHGLVKATDLLLHYGLEPAKQCLKQFSIVHQVLIPNCYDQLLLDLDKFAEQEESCIHPKVWVLKEKIENLRRTKMLTESEVKVLVVCKRQSGSVSEQLEQGFRKTSVCLLTGTPDYQKVLELLEQHWLLVWAEGSGIDHLPCSQFTLVIEWEGSDSHSSASCASYCLRQNISVISLYAVTPKSFLGPSSHVIKEGHPCGVFPSEKEDSGTGDDKSSTYSFVVSEEIVGNVELHYFLSSLYNINPMERCLRDLIDGEESDRGWADVYLDERTCILLKPLTELRNASFISAITKQLIFLSLQTSKCYLLLYQDPISDAGYVFRNSVVKALTRLTATCDLLKTADYQVSVLYAYNLQEVAQLMRMIGESTCASSTMWNKDQWTHRPWLMSQMSSHERLLLALPCINPISAQVILTALPLRDVLMMSLAVLSDSLPWISNKVLKLMHSLLHSENRISPKPEVNESLNIKEEDLLEPHPCIQTGVIYPPNLTSQPQVHLFGNRNNLEHSRQSLSSDDASDGFGFIPKPQDTGNFVYPVGYSDHSLAEPNATESDMHNVFYESGNSSFSKASPDHDTSVILDPKQFLNSVRNNEIPEFEMTKEEVGYSGQHFGSQLQSKQEQSQHLLYQDTCPRKFFDFEDSSSQVPTQNVPQSSNVPYQLSQMISPQASQGNIPQDFSGEYQKVDIVLPKQYQGSHPSARLSVVSPYFSDGQEFRPNDNNFKPPLTQSVSSSHLRVPAPSSYSREHSRPIPVFPIKYFADEVVDSDCASIKEEEISSGQHFQDNIVPSMGHPFQHPDISPSQQVRNPYQDNVVGMTSPYCAASQMSVPPSPLVTLRQDGRGHDYPDHYEFPPSQVRLPKYNPRRRLSYAKVPGQGGQTKLVFNARQNTDDRLPCDQREFMSSQMKLPWSSQHAVSPSVKLGYTRPNRRGGQTKLTFQHL